MKKITFLLIALCGVTISGFAQYTAIPDANFEQALIDALIDKDGIVNAQILTADAAAVTGELNVNTKNISDFTGIKAFTGITILSAKFNPNATIDISGMTNVTSFAVEINPNLTTANVSGCTGLQQLYATGCPNLITLNTTGCAALTRLYSYDTKITSLDLSTATLLDRLYCYNSELTSLNVSNSPVITRLYCYNNKLTFLNAKSGGNTVMVASHFRAALNPSLSCIQVDDATYSTTNWNNKDATASFNESCALGTEDFETFKLSIYPNPINNGAFYISTQSNGIKSVQIFDVLGKQVYAKKIEANESVKVSNLGKGTYIVKVKENGKIATRKLVVN